MPDQELNTATATYWEGGSYSSKVPGNVIPPRQGVELTGYANRLDIYFQRVRLKFKLFLSDGSGNVHSPQA